MRYLVLTVAVLLLAVVPAGGAEGELGLTAAVTLPAEDITGRFSGSVNPDPTCGLRAGVVISPRVEWFADLTMTSLETMAFLGDGAAVALRTGIDLMMNPGKAERWFVSAGAGYGEIDYGRSFYDFDYTFGSIGCGQRYDLQGGRRLRWELRADVNPTGAGPMDNRFHMLHSMVSLTWGLGGSRSGGSGDHDHDGVQQNLDRCPDTAAGWPVDPSGCPLDSDGDRVPDGRDECSGTHPQAKVGADGCALDSDGDNVADGLDNCSGTPAGVLVGLRGCPLDTDRDGVYDGIDRCPGTAAGTDVDATGCPN